MRRSVVIFLVVSLAVGACSGDSDAPGGGSSTTVSPSGKAAPSPSFHTATAVIETDEEPVLVYVEVAQTPEQWELGLMFRESLAEDRGMVFIFFKPTECCFWMKNTLIPLSIAFFGKNGRIRRILDMEPCREDPCPVYVPGVRYWGALEVNQGAFEKWGVSEGDVIHLNQ